MNDRNLQVMQKFFFLKFDLGHAIVNQFRKRCACSRYIKIDGMTIMPA